MGRVAFKTKAGKAVSFTTGKKKKRRNPIKNIRKNYPAKPKKTKRRVNTMAKRRTYKRKSGTSTKTHLKNVLLGVGAAALLGEGTVGALGGYFLGGPVGAIGGWLGGEGISGFTGGLGQGGGNGAIRVYS